MYFVCLICVMMIVVAGPLQFFGEVPAMQCLPWWMGYGNLEACLKWHSSKCPFGCANSTKTCSGHVGGDTSNTFNINDIYHPSTIIQPKGFIIIDQMVRKRFTVTVN